MAGEIAHGTTLIYSFFSFVTQNTMNIHNEKLFEGDET